MSHRSSRSAERHSEGGGSASNTPRNGASGDTSGYKQKIKELE